jgi:GNAT superfamily N-acetyltransferase
LIKIKNAPYIPGLIFRHLRGESDYASIAAVLTASEAADHIERMVSAEDFAQALQRVSNCDPYQDMILAEVTGEVVGYARGWWSDGPDSSRSYDHNGFLVPQWRRKGLGTAMLVWMEQHLGEIADSHPAEIAKFFQVNVTQFQKGRAILLERHGYQPARYYFEMVRPTLDDIPEHPLPEGLEVRPAEPEQYRSIWNAVVETSGDEWGHKKLTEEDYQEWLASPLFQPVLWQVAWKIGTQQAVGHVLTYIHHDENKQFNRRRGYTESIGVVQSWRRCGVARALISRSLQAQKAAGMTESALVADSENENNATQLYESCGFEIVKKDTLYRKPLE